MREEVIEELFK